jgi:anti-sigma factor RsiW
VATRPEQLRLTPDERVDLVAYIDGELPEAHARSIETKLIHSATARREVEMLRKTWALLDHLARPQVSEKFTEKTISNIQRLDLGLRSWEPTLAAWSALLARAIVCLLIGGAFLGMGYAATRWLWPDPTARLVQDLTLAEHLDEYLEVGTFEFLSQLADSREFGGVDR